jgi:bifunctional NMN adenylyltransferase/nudix hydrolase
MTKTKDLTVLIGRFSPFHNGHATALKRALQTSKAVLVLVGSAGQARTTKNPFTFDERANMIHNYVTSEFSETRYNLRIKPLYDHPYNDQAWIRGVQDAVDQVKNELVDVIGLNPTIYLTGADRDRSTWYLKTFGDMFKLDLIDPKFVDMSLSATNIRDILFSSTAKAYSFSMMVPDTTLEALVDFTKTSEYEDLVKEYQYLEKYKKSYESSPYPVTIQTVDACVIQSGHVLVCVRDNFPGKGLWCMPGGHLEVERHETLQEAMLRELEEETRIELSRAQLIGSIKSKECFDHPDRSLKGRVITMCYLLKLDDSKSLPKVRPQKGEVKKVMWVPLNEALNNPQNWFDDHVNMLSTMVGRV